jgi:hypothetical protein
VEEFAWRGLKENHGSLCYSRTEFLQKTNLGATPLSSPLNALGPSDTGRRGPPTAAEDTLDQGDSVANTFPSSEKHPCNRPWRPIGL